MRLRIFYVDAGEAGAAVAFGAKGEGLRCLLVRALTQRKSAVRADRVSLSEGSISVVAEKRKRKRRRN